MVEAVSLQVFGQVGVDQPEFAVLGIGIGLSDRALAAADRFHFRSGQRNAGLKIFEDFVVEAGLTIDGDFHVGEGYAAADAAESMFRAGNDRSVLMLDSLLPGGQLRPNR